MKRVYQYVGKHIRSVNPGDLADYSLKQNGYDQF